MCNSELDIVLGKKGLNHMTSRSTFQHQLFHDCIVIKGQGEQTGVQGTKTKQNPTDAVACSPVKYSYRMLIANVVVQ